jgi:DNA polymerase-3 subunit delta'
VAVHFRMPLPPLYGHEGIRNRLVGAVASGRLPQALLLEGPRGVGKQRLALWVAQALMCDGERGRGKGEACGLCRPCRLVLTLSHPDLHWFVPIELEKRAADPDKQVELAEEALGEALALRRDQPLYEPPSGMASHGIASVRLLLRKLTLTPVMGPRKVFIVGDADRLVPQTGAEAAANALLKALEEPPADTVFLLTTAEPDALLPTILSRVARARVARLDGTVVTAFAQRELGLSADQTLSQTVSAADGCIGRLLAVRQGLEGDERAVQFLLAVRHGTATRLGFALAQHPFQARGAFTEMLDDLLVRLRSEARTGKDVGKVVSSIAQVLNARELAQGNVNPQLVAAVLGEDLGSLG